jgi:hypothetical protein
MNGTMAATYYGHPSLSAQHPITTHRPPDNYGASWITNAQAHNRLCLPRGKSVVWRLTVLRTYHDPLFLLPLQTSVSSKH